ncbi:ATP-binding protein [Candidatus Woesearchaeota archaeon]|nr:ATP-binding protein [Candidatus Woesearchaeota archaeon]
MAKKKHSAAYYLGWVPVKYTAKGIRYGVYYLGRGFGWSLYHVGKGIGNGVKWGYTAIKTKRQEAKAEQLIQEKRPNSNATYHQFDQVHSFAGNYTDFETKFLNMPSMIGIIIGARGTGKSALGMKLLENVQAKTGRIVCAMGFKQESLPAWIQIVNTLEEIPSHSVVLLDEAGIEFSSRSSMSNVNKLLSSLMLVARHKDLSILFISQNSSNLDINILRQADFLFLKPSSLLQKDFEREKIKDMYADVSEHFHNHKHLPGLVYVYSDPFRGFVTNPLPSFWNQQTSKAYSGFSGKK